MCLGVIADVGTAGALVISALSLSVSAWTWWRSNHGRVRVRARLARDAEITIRSTFLTPVTVKYLEEIEVVAKRRWFRPWRLSVTVWGTADRLPVVHGLSEFPATLRRGHKETWTVAAVYLRPTWIVRVQTDQGYWDSNVVVTGGL